MRTKRDRFHRISRFVDGRGGFLSTRRVPDALEVAFVRSYLPHAQIVAIDVRRAEAVEGVHAVLTGRELPGDLVDRNQVPGATKTPQPVLATDAVRYVGQPVALVMAVDLGTAIDAAELVEITYSQQPTTMSVADAHQQGADSTVYDERLTYGDIDTAFEMAEVTSRTTLAIGRATAVPLEPRGIAAIPTSGGQGIHIITGSQTSEYLRQVLAGILGLDSRSISVEHADAGGGFGQRIAAHPEEVAVAAAAHFTQRPARWVESRTENLTAAPQGRGIEFDIRLAATSEGTLLGIRATIEGDAGAYSFNSSSALVEAYLAAQFIPGPYELSAYEATVRIGRTNRPPISPYRGVGYASSQTAREYALDELAALCRLDPRELRRRNLVAQESVPYRTCNGITLEAATFHQALAKVSERIDVWRSDDAVPPSNIVSGFGAAVFIEPTGWGSRGMAELGWSAFPAAEQAAVAVLPDGSFTISVPVTCQGQGHEITLARVCAETLGVDEDRCFVRTDSQFLRPSPGGTRASRVAVVVGDAVAKASRTLRTELEEFVARWQSVPSDSVTMRDGQFLISTKAEQVALELEAVLEAIFHRAETSLGVEPATTLAVGTSDPPPSYGSGACGVEVAVDTETGDVRVVRCAIVDDCGRIIDRQVVDGQLAGGAAQGIGLALYESATYAPSGQPTATTLADYTIPGAPDLPIIELDHVSSDPTTVKGVGEAGAIAAPAAIVCAVHDAFRSLDVDCSDIRLPLTPMDVWRRLKG